MFFNDTAREAYICVNTYNERWRQRNVSKNEVFMPRGMKVKEIA